MQLLLQMSDLFFIFFKNGSIFVKATENVTNVRFRIESFIFATKDSGDRSYHAQNPFLTLLHRLEQQIKFQKVFLNYHFQESAGTNTTRVQNPFLQNNLSIFTFHTSITMF